MSDEAAFLSTCAADPEDATARLVFADWLDEQNDFRGEFVRLGVEFDRTPPYDLKRFQLAEKLRELLESPPFKQWLPTDSFLKWGWRRGFLRVAADIDKLEDSEPVELAEWLATLWVERADCEGYSHRSQPIWNDTFALFRHARELFFQTDNYGPGVLTRLREWQHLRSLRIPYLDLPWADIAAMPHLRSLTLDNPDWTMMPELHKARLPNLEVLKIDKEWNDELPHWGSVCPKLRSLTLEHYNTYPDEQCDRFAECSQLRHLALYQRYQPFKAVGLKALAKMKELRSLTLGPWPRGSIEVLSKLTKLERLGGYGASNSIRGLDSLVNLRWLEVGVGKFTKKLAGQIASLPQLARLDIASESIEEDSLSSLAKSQSLGVLTARTRDKKVPLPELTHLQALGYLRVAAELTPEQITSLQTALPNCRIVNAYRDDDPEYDWA
jgi:uncharacterized protein (TIGR02996 family)